MPPNERRVSGEQGEFDERGRRPERKRGRRVLCTRMLGDRSFVELQADPRRHDHVKLPPTPCLHIQRPYLRGQATVLLKQRVEVGHSNAEAGIVSPLTITVLNDVEGDSVPPDASHCAALPDDGEAHVTGVKLQRCVQACSRRNQRSDLYELCAHAMNSSKQSPNGWRVSGSRGAKGDERGRCTRWLGGAMP